MHPRFCFCIKGEPGGLISSHHRYTPFHSLPGAVSSAAACLVRDAHPLLSSCLTSTPSYRYVCHDVPCLSESSNIRQRRPPLIFRGSTLMCLRTRIRQAACNRRADVYRPQSLPEPYQQPHPPNRRRIANSGYYIYRPHMRYLGKTGQSCGSGYFRFTDRDSCLYFFPSLIIYFYFVFSRLRLVETDAYFAVDFGDWWELASPCRSSNDICCQLCQQRLHD